MKKLILSLVISTGLLTLSLPLSAQNNAAKTTKSESKPVLAKDEVKKPANADANKPTPPLAPEVNKPVTGPTIQADASKSNTKGPEGMTPQYVDRIRSDQGVNRTEYKVPASPNPSDPKLVVTESPRAAVPEPPKTSKPVTSKEQ